VLTLLIVFFLIFFFCSVLEMLADPIKYEAKQHEARQKRKAKRAANIMKGTGWKS
jgi:hypothetical protein